MSEEAPAKPKKGGGMKKILIMAVGAIALIGAGVGAGIYASGAGLAGGKHEEPKEDPNKPKLVPKHGEGGEEPLTPRGNGDGNAEEFDRSRYKATYYAIEQPFTSNLRDSDGFMQVGIGVATYYDSRVVDNLKNNEMPVRSAILMVLANQDAIVISEPEGKKKLQAELKDAINQVLISREGFGGIDDVYFTSLIIQ